MSCEARAGSTHPEPWQPAPLGGGWRWWRQQKKETSTAPGLGGMRGSKGLRPWTKSLASPASPGGESKGMWAHNAFWRGVQRFWRSTQRPAKSQQHLTKSVVRPAKSNNAFGGAYNACGGAHDAFGGAHNAPPKANNASPKAFDDFRDDPRNYQGSMRCSRKRKPSPPRAVGTSRGATAAHRRTHNPTDERTTGGIHCHRWWRSAPCHAQRA